MILQGYITDEQGNVLQNIYVTTGDMNTKEIWYSYELWPQGNYSVNVPDDQINSGGGLFIKKEGYQDLQVSFATLAYYDSTIVMQKGAGSNNSVLWIGAAVAAAVLYQNSSSKKKVGEITEGQAKAGLYIAGGVLAWVLLKDLFEALGIFKSKEEIQLDNAANNPGSFWNPNYWLSKPDNIPYTQPVVTLPQAQYFAEQIFDAMSWYDDKEEVPIGIFRSMPSQAAASFLCYVFQKTYGYDMLSWLRGGVWPKDRLSDADVADITNFVNRLPKY